MLRRYIILLFLTLVLMTSDKVFKFDTIRAALQTPLLPISYGLYKVSYSTNSLAQFIVSLPSVYRENIRLQEKVISLEESLVELNELRSQNEALKNQLNVVRDKTREKVMASVVGLDNSGESVLIVINKGTRDGLKQDMIATLSDALVGRVVKVNWSSAYILPIMAVGSKVPVEVQSPRVSTDVPKGLLIGVFNKDIQLTEVLQKYELYNGDLVVVSGEGGVYPAGLLVGRVKQVISEDNEIFKTAVLTPMWNLDKLKNVFIDIDSN